AGIDFSETRLIPGESDNLYFLTKRFDRKPNNQRVHVHTLAGLINSNFRVADCDYETLIKVCSKLTKSHKETAQLFRRMIFNVMSGNRDEEKWDDPFTFNVTREGPRHLSFGYGQHLCIGWRLAEMQLKVLLEELLARYPDIHATGAVSRMRSNFLNSIKSMPVMSAPPWRSARILSLETRFNCPTQTRLCPQTRIPSRSRGF
ncbi:MAG: cytochrome P450, partial [Planctomycetes bacterium]|nr:cytochrome P450 [Planctomycetota bacterium]